MLRLRMLAVVSFAVTSFAAERPALSGVIFDEKEAPLAGAMVYIYTAKPRVGAGVLCPSCYADCTKYATSNAQGQFEIASLDPTLLFKVLIVADDHQPLFVDDVDPAAGPIKSKMLVIEPERLKPGHVVRGRVFDPVGKPVLGAKIEVVSQHFPNRAVYGLIDGTDEVAASNKQGEFLITSEQAEGVYGIKVSARGLAPRNVENVQAEEQWHSISLDYGSTLNGTVMKNGLPVAGVVMGFCHADRAGGAYLGDWTTTSDDRGHFSFSNLPASIPGYLYGRIDGMQGLGAVPAVKLQTGPNEGVVDAKTISITQGNRFSGKVVLSDGNAVPPGTRVLLSRDDAWDSTTVVVSEDGSFEVANLPNEGYSVNCSVRGYHFSKENYSLDPLNKNGLMGVIDQDISGVVLLLEPGQFEWTQSSPEESQRYSVLEQERIRGASLTK